MTRQAGLKAGREGGLSELGIDIGLLDMTCADQQHDEGGRAGGRATPVGSSQRYMIVLFGLPCGRSARAPRCSGEYPSVASAAISIPALYSTYGGVRKGRHAVRVARSGWWVGAVSAIRR